MKRFLFVAFCLGRHQILERDASYWIKCRRKKDKTNKSHFILKIITDSTEMKDVSYVPISNSKLNNQLNEPHEKKNSAIYVEENILSFEEEEKK